MNNRLFDSTLKANNEVKSIFALERKKFSDNFSIAFWVKC